MTDKGGYKKDNPTFPLFPCSPPFSVSSVPPW